MRLAENIKFLRKQMDISQNEVSDKMNTSRQTISKWENGQSQPSIEMLIDLANWFEVTIDDLIRKDYSAINHHSLIFENHMVENISQQQKNDLELDGITEDMILFPQISAEEIYAYQIFKTAYEMEMNIKKTKDTSVIVEVKDLYLEAFDLGITDAAVNILSMISRTTENININNPCEKQFPFQDRMDYYIDRLEEADHPAGSYYRAILLIRGLVGNGNTDEDKQNEGLALMQGLVNEGNEYAIDFFDLIENEEDDDISVN